jgi:hypothetical protein
LQDSIVSPLTVSQRTAYQGGDEDKHTNNPVTEIMAKERIKTNQYKQVYLADIQPTPAQKIL